MVSGRQPAVRADRDRLYRGEEGMVLCQAMASCAGGCTTEAASVGTVN